ncbi:hypothetical protein [Komagataeibacter kakiaceti]
MPASVCSDETDYLLFLLLNRRFPVWVKMETRHAFPASYGQETGPGKKLRRRRPEFETVSFSEDITYDFCRFRKKTFSEQNAYSRNDMCGSHLGLCHHGIGG